MVPTMNEHLSSTQEVSNADILSALNVFAQSVENRFDRVEQRLDNHDQQFEKMEEQIREMQNSIDYLIQTTTNIKTEQTSLLYLYRTHDRRIEILERKVS